MFGTDKNWKECSNTVLTLKWEKENKLLIPVVSYFNLIFLKYYNKRGKSDSFLHFDYFFIPLVLIFSSCGNEFLPAVFTICIVPGSQHTRTLCTFSYQENSSTKNLLTNIPIKSYTRSQLDYLLRNRLLVIRR